MQEDTFKGSGNLCEREAKLTPCSLLAPRQKHLVSRRSCSSSHSPGTNCQRQFLTCEAFKGGAWGRRGEVGAAPLHFIREVFEQQTCQRLCGEFGQSQIYYPLPKFQAGARCRQVVCWMLQPDSLKVLLHSQWNQWVPQFRIHLFLNCTGRDYMFWQTPGGVLSALWILSPWNIIMPNCSLNLLPSRIPQPSCGLPNSTWESARCLSQSSLALFLFKSLAKVKVEFTAGKQFRVNCTHKIDKLHLKCRIVNRNDFILFYQS